MFESLSQQTSAVAAIAAAAAAVFTYMQARNTRQTLAAQLMLTFSERYSAPEMSNALRLLLQWQKENPSDFAEKWYLSFQNKDQYAIQLDDARRIISIYFIDIYLLHKHGQIRRHMAFNLLERFGLDVYNICHPMYKKLYPENYPDYAGLLKSVRPSYIMP
jgi:hypothetical protein